MKNKETFADIIKRRQGCKVCHCDDNLCQFETKLLPMDEHTDLLSPWCPFGENPLDAEILIIGQDFGIVKYLEDAKDIAGLHSLEKSNSTNKKLCDYLKLAGLDNKGIYFTNAILCIKNGVSKKTKNGTSMSSKVEIDWFKNCSSEFLLPLISDHLPNLKTIITLGKYALFSINHIADSQNQEAKPLIGLVAKKQDIHISNKQYTLIPMLHPSFDHLSVRGHEKEGKKAKDLWEDIRSFI